MRLYYITQAYSKINDILLFHQVVISLSSLFPPQKKPHKNETALYLYFNISHSKAIGLLFWLTKEYYNEVLLQAMYAVHWFLIFFLITHLDYHFYLPSKLLVSTRLHRYLPYMFTILSININLLFKSLIFETVPKILNL